jgi:outer membrane immunogenic protein
VKKLLLATVSAVALTGAAQAADMSAPAPVYKAPQAVAAPTWAGFYAGVQGGVASHWGWFNDLDAFFTFGSAAESRNADAIGGFAGGHVGVNWQDRSFVYGLEADGNWVSAKASDTWNGNGSTANQSLDVRWLASVRGRAGLALDTTLLYVTGGVAFGGVKDSANLVNGSGAAINGFTLDQTRVGWTAGGGIEHMFSPHWTARAEARIVDLGRATVNCSAVTSSCPPNIPSNQPYRGEFSNKLLMGLLGLDYKF